mmetsp:Transcript_5998/g.15971  ORF Transcript_5998/g.15971 Transcript_5998/m.15971 type:complete len:335 (+) Transcript_5998:484-1488(+)
MVHSGCGLASQFHDLQAVPWPIQADIGGDLHRGCEAGHDADHLLPLVPGPARRQALPETTRSHTGYHRHHAAGEVLPPQPRVSGDELCCVLGRFRGEFRNAPATLQPPLPQAVHRQVAEAKQGVPPVPPGHTGHAECSRQEEGLGGGSRRQGAPRSRRASGPRTRCSFIIGEVERAVRRRLTDAPRARCAVVLSGIVSGGQLRPRSLSTARTFEKDSMSEHLGGASPCTDAANHRSARRFRPRAEACSALMRHRRPALFRLPRLAQGTLAARARASRRAGGPLRLPAPARLFVSAAKLARPTPARDERQRCSPAAGLLCAATAGTGPALRSSSW